MEPRLKRSASRKRAPVHARSLPPYILLGMTRRTMICITGLQPQNDREWAQANSCCFSS